MTLEGIHEFSEGLSSYGVMCSMKVPMGADVRDPNRPMVVSSGQRAHTTSKDCTSRKRQKIKLGDKNKTTWVKSLESLLNGGCKRRI
jgi:hypothetical protein